MRQSNENTLYEVWWLKPMWAFGGTTGVVALLALLVPSKIFEQSWRTPKYYDASTLLYVVAAIMAFVLGGLAARACLRGGAGNASKLGMERDIPWGTALFLFRVSFVLALFGYASWGYSAAAHGVSWDLILGAMKGTAGVTYELRESYLTTISGITTMTQFGIAAFVLGIPIGFVRGWKAVRIPLVMLFVLAVLRAIINSERLAAIELAVPVMVSSIMFGYSRTGKRSKALAFAPLAGMLFVLIVFTAGEYSRSWTTFYKGGDQTLWEFTSARLLGYYVTALNNTAYLWRTTPDPLGAPFFTMSFLWRFPIIGEFVHDFFFGMAIATPTHYMDLLANGANPEFNNTGGILLPLIDYGVSNGLFFWMLFGAAMQTVYTAFVRGAPAGFCLYPAMYVGLLEIPRIFYWGDARFFPAFCMLVLCSLLLSMETRKELVLGWRRLPAAT